MKGYEEFSDAKTIECLCPKCEKIHYKQIFWTGIGIPKIMCWNCKTIIKKDILPEKDEHKLTW